MATAGILKVTVVEARVEKDQNTFGDMDPYVEIEHRMERFKTKVSKDGGKEPKFNETFEYNVKYIGDDFTMRLMNKNSMLNDDLMGEATIKVSSLCLPGCDDWWVVTVKGKTAGHIHFTAVWEPRDSQTKASELAEKDAELARLKEEQRKMELQNMQMQHQTQMAAMQNQAAYGGYQQPMGYGGYGQVHPQQQQQVTTTTYVSPSGDEPTQITCRTCQHTGMTKCETDDSQQWLWFWILFGLGWILGGMTWLFCWAPFLVPSLKTCRHRCSNCNNVA